MLMYHLLSSIWRANRQTFLRTLVYFLTPTPTGFTRKIERTALRGKKAVPGKTIIHGAISAAPVAGSQVISGVQEIASDSSNRYHNFDSQAAMRMKCSSQGLPS